MKTLYIYVKKHLKKEKSQKRSTNCWCQMKRISNYQIMINIKKKYNYSDKKFYEMCRKALITEKNTEKEFVKLTSALNMKEGEK